MARKTRRINFINRKCVLVFRETEVTIAEPMWGVQEGHIIESGGHIYVVLEVRRTIERRNPAHPKGNKAWVRVEVHVDFAVKD